MIRTAQEFVSLRASEVPEEYRRTAHEEAPEDVWRPVIEGFPAMRRWVAHNKTIPESIVRILAEDADPEVRAWIANKRSTPSDVLEMLARDKDDFVRQRVAYNKKAPRHVLEILADDPLQHVAEGARKGLAGL